VSSQELRREPEARVDRELAVGLYRQMRLIRRFEDEVAVALPQGRGVRHDASLLRQEAIAVGFASALQDGDRVACTYRGHGHALAAGTPPGALLAEFTGRATGINGGRAGSMNVVGTPSTA